MITYRGPGPSPVFDEDVQVFWARCDGCNIKVGFKAGPEWLDGQDRDANARLVELLRENGCNHTEPMRRWWDFRGDVVELAADVPLTMYDGLNHAISVWEGGAIGQMLTRCGKRACPYPKLREVPGRGPVDCGECIEMEAP